MKNFAAFGELKIDFSRKVNVIIGENGTGKTHLLKTAYALCWGASLFKDKPEVSKKEIEKDLTSKLVRLFMPLDDKLGKIHRQGATENAKLESYFALDKKLMISFFNNSKSIKLHNNGNYEQYGYEPVLIPTKEVLSLINGITQRNTDKKMIKAIFDDTYLDLCNFLLRPEAHVSPERLDFDPRFGTVFPKLTNAIGGKYEFTDGHFYFQCGSYEERRVKNQHEYGDRTETIFKPITGSELSNNMTAEGFRKIGILQQLLTNKSLNPGVSGPLFWDEPEANMNPKLMKTLVNILLELSRNGQQIILATHDYVLLKWFDLLMDKGKADHVRFHALYRNPESREIMIESTNNYLEINPNSIADTFSDLMDHDIYKSMGGGGR